MIATKHRTVFAVLLATTMGIVGYFLFRPVVAAEVLRPPEFDDVSAFGEDETSRVDAWLQDQNSLAKYPSLSVAVVRDGEIVYRGAFGFEDIKADRKATPQTLYPVASVTKAFTASLAVILHDRGVIDLDQPVVKYLPTNVSISTTPELGATITLRQLASHTSGFPRGVPGPVQSVEAWYDLEPQRLYAHLASIKLESDPGTAEEYSNLGFGLLGHALERAAEKPFELLLQELVCNPLQLKTTAIPTDDKLRSATGYDSSGWRFETNASFRERLASSGGLVTSVEDLAKFLSAQMKPGVFSSEMLSQLHTESKLSDGSKARTALGWSVDSSDYVGRILEKNGGRSNCSAWIGFAPEHEVGVAVVTNCGGPAVDSIGRWLLERSVPSAHQPVTKHGYAKVAPYTGVLWENDRPIVQVRNGWHPLASINGLPIDQIMEFAHKEFGTLAHKRFGEDLVELLSKMGHEPKWEVTLGLKTKDGQVEHLQIRMTEESRDLVRQQSRVQ
ncbi:serine hydrolase domain-containing protein [Pirellulaceae bacterium SH501]